MIKSRKGEGIWLFEEGAKIVIAVLCIGALFYLLIYLYISNVHNTKFQHAKSLLLESDNSIEKVIKRVKAGQGSLNGNSEKILIHEPRGWYLFSFAENDLEPNSCVGKNCLCICDNVAGFNLGHPFTSEEERQVVECDSGGVCLVVEDLRKFREIKIVDPITILIKFDKGISIT